MKSENITKKMLKKIRNHQDGRKSGGQLHVGLNAKRIEENLKKKTNYHTLMTTQRRHRFFFLFTKCTSTDKCLKPSPFETFRRTVEGTFNLSQYGKHIIAVKIAKLCCHWLKYFLKKTKFTTVHQKENRWSRHKISVMAGNILGHDA